MSSIEPDEYSGEVDCSEKVTSGLVVAGGDSAILLELVEEILDQMARLIQMLVIFARLLTTALGRDDDAFAIVLQRYNHPLFCVIGFIGDDSVRLDVRQQGIGAFQVMSLSWRQMKAGRIAQGIDGRVDLGAQPATAASDRLCFGAPFLAPALC